MTNNEESEGHDRTDLVIPGVQEQLVQAITDAVTNTKPVIVVMMNGGPLDVTNLKQNQYVDSIMWVGYPGQSGGSAIADLIFGKASPAGRLTTTIYPASYLNGLSMFDMNMRPNTATNYPGRTYRFYTGNAVYPFGWGLSYATWSIQWVWGKSIVHAHQVAAHLVEFKNAPHKAPILVTISATITNTNGGRFNSIADFVALLFLTPPTPGVNGNVLQSLSGFERVSLGPNQQITVEFGLDAFKFTSTDATGKFQPMAGLWKARIEDSIKEIHVI
jgi:beta-D-xylosidase 4